MAPERVASRRVTVMSVRPLNACRSCGHTWYPRGSDLSRECPRCHAPADPQDILAAQILGLAAEMERLTEEAKNNPEMAAVLKQADDKRQGTARPDKGTTWLAVLIVVGLVLLFSACMGGLSRPTPTPTLEKQDEKTAPGQQKPYRDAVREKFRD